MYKWLYRPFDICHGEGKEQARNLLNLRNTSPSLSILNQRAILKRRRRPEFEEATDTIESQSSMTKFKVITQSIL